MPAKKTASVKKVAKRTTKSAPDVTAAASAIPVQMEQFLKQTAVPKGFARSRPVKLHELQLRLNEIGVQPTVPLDMLLGSIIASNQQQSR